MVVILKKEQIGMTEVCIIEGCESPVAVKKRQMCRRHYVYWQRANKVNTKDRVCSIEDCGKLVYSRGWCRNHYANWYRNGEPETNKERPLCWCGVVASSRGLCHNHYHQWYRKNREKTDGVESLRKESVGYNGAHARVKATRGLASDYTCQDCPREAEHWSLNAGAEEMIVETKNPRQHGMLYSLNIWDYDPRCAECHAEYDKANNLQRARRGKPSKRAAL